jgi:hypothetical protein
MVCGLFLCRLLEVLEHPIVLYPAIQDKHLAAVWTEKEVLEVTFARWAPDRFWLPRCNGHAGGGDRAFIGPVS